MSEGIPYKKIMHDSDTFHSKPKHKALQKAKGMTGKSQKQQMRFVRQNRDYQKKIGRAWND